MRTRLCVCPTLALAAVLCPVPASAHLNSTSMGSIYDGVTHFLTSPQDVLPALALALLAGLRGPRHGRGALFALSGAWLLGGFVGVSASATAGSAILSSAWLLLLGGLLAADAKLSARVTLALAALLGLYHGYLNGTGLGLSASAAAALLGLASALFVLVALAAAFVVPLRAQWTRIAVRVAGSWIAATGLLLLGWAARGG